MQIIKGAVLELITINELKQMDILVLKSLVQVLIGPSAVSDSRGDLVLQICNTLSISISAEERILLDAQKEYFAIHGRDMAQMGVGPTDRAARARQMLRQIEMRRPRPRPSIGPNGTPSNCPNGTEETINGVKFVTWFGIRVQLRHGKQVPWYLLHEDRYPKKSENSTPTPTATTATSGNKTMSLSPMAKDFSSLPKPKNIVSATLSVDPSLILSSDPVQPSQSSIVDVPSVPLPPTKENSVISPLTEPPSESSQHPQSSVVDVPSLPLPKEHSVILPLTEPLPGPSQHPGSSNHSIPQSSRPLKRKFSVAFPSTPALTEPPLDPSRHLGSSCHSIPQSPRPLKRQKGKSSPRKPTTTKSADVQSICPPDPSPHPGTPSSSPTTDERQSSVAFPLTEPPPDPSQHPGSSSHSTPQPPRPHKRQKKNSSSRKPSTKKSADALSKCAPDSSPHPGTLSTSISKSRTAGGGVKTRRTMLPPPTKQHSMLFLILHRWVRRGERGPLKGLDVNVKGKGLPGDLNLNSDSGSGGGVRIRSREVQTRSLKLDASQMRRLRQHARRHGKLECKAAPAAAADGRHLGLRRQGSGAELGSI